MVEIDIIEQRPVSLVEVKEMLETAKKTIKELNFRAEKVSNYLADNVSIDKNKYKELYEKLSKLEKLRDRLIVKILDVMPEDIDTLKTLFTGEAISLKGEELKQILDVLKE